MWVAGDCLQKLDWVVVSIRGLEARCNNPDPPLVDIVLFGLSLSGFPSRL